jgi:hypothetical protein
MGLENSERPKTGDGILEREWARVAGTVCPTVAATDVGVSAVTTRSDGFVPRAPSWGARGGVAGVGADVRTAGGGRGRK